MGKFVACLSFLALSALAQDSVGLEDAAVLSTVVQSMCTGLVTHGESGYLVLSDRSEEVGNKEGRKEFDRGALASLINRNSVSHQLPSITLCPGVRVFKHDDIRAAIETFSADYFNDDFISNFRQAFPGSFGPTGMSLPGYADNCESALVVVSNAGGSFYYLLRKVEGKWSVEKTVYRSIA